MLKSVAAKAAMAATVHTTHSYITVLHTCMPKYGQVLTCMGLEGVWLQLVIQTKEILIK